MTMNDPQHTPRTVVIGAGPAGLTAAWWLARRGVLPLVLEADAQVGGMARTVEYKGYRFDIGGHRFFSKVGAVERLWRTMLGGRVPAAAAAARGSTTTASSSTTRSSRSNALRGLGICRLAAGAAQLSVAQVAADPARAELRGLGVNRFGRLLFEIFFKTYTEKVWGIPVQRDRRAVGRAADQGAVAAHGRRGHALRGIRSQRRRRDQDADRGVRVSPARARA